MALAMFSWQIVETVAIVAMSTLSRPTSLAG